MASAIVALTLAVLSPRTNVAVWQVSVGPVASRLTVTDFVVVPPALVALQVFVVPAVSVEIVDGPHPVERQDRGLGVRDRPVDHDVRPIPVFEPSVPVTVEVTFGGLVSLRLSTSHFEAWVVRTVTRTSVPAPPTNAAV